MKIRSAVIVLYALLLMIMSSDVSAKNPSHVAIHHQRSPHIFAPARQTQIPQYRTPSDIYESYSGGHQFYPNPDRDFFGPNPNCGGDC
jgi:hypothetical protein